MTRPHSTSAPGVLYALDSAGAVTLPGHATPQAQYRCLACNEPVSPVRAHTRQVGRTEGRTRTVTVKAHFSHRKESHCVATGESILHLACKTWIGQSLERHRGLSVQLTCQNCAEPAVFVQGLGPTDRSRTEVRIGEYRADVAVVGEGGAAEFVVEVRFTHQVSECKALGLEVPWVEVQADPELLTGREQPLTLVALNTNLFFHQPCECGNDASSYPQAQERRHVRLEAEHRARLAEQQRQREVRFQQETERRQAEARERRHVRALEEARALLSRQQRNAEIQQARREIETFLAVHVPDIGERLMLYSCVLAACPGCGVRSAFFDSSGMNMVPTWSKLVVRQTPDHPWEPVCPVCGWHGPAPRGGERVTFHGGQQRDQRRAPVVERLAVRFWWQDEE